MSEEKIKLGFFERWKIRKMIKSIKKSIDLQKDISLELSKRMDNLSKNDIEILEGLRVNMIDAILGNKEDGKVGLSSIFEIENDDGSPITKEDLEKESLDDLTNLLEDLINNLQKEI